MKTAFISDIHGNLTALKAVFADIDSHQPDQIISLGDTVGYGPQPRECLALVREKCSLVLMGKGERIIFFRVGNQQYTFHYNFSHIEGRFACALITRCSLLL